MLAGNPTAGGTATQTRQVPGPGRTQRTQNYTGENTQGRPNRKIRKISFLYGIPYINFIINCEPCSMYIQVLTTIIEQSFCYSVKTCDG